MKKLIACFLITFSSMTYAAELDISRTNLRANVPGSDNTAAYMSAINISKKDVRIIGLESNVAEFTELHTHTMKGDRMLMRQVDYVDIDAGEKVLFAPNSYHIMLINLKQRVKHGETAEITFFYDDETSQTVNFNIIDPRKVK